MSCFGAPLFFLCFLMFFLGNMISHEEVVWTAIMCHEMHVGGSSGRGRRGGSDRPCAPFTCVGMGSGTLGSGGALHTRRIFVSPHGGRTPATSGRSSSRSSMPWRSRRARAKSGRTLYGLWRALGPCREGPHWIVHGSISNCGIGCAV